MANKTQNLLIQAVTSDKKYVIINLHDIKHNIRFEGAEVLKTLFGVNDNSPYGKFKMKTNEKGYVTILDDLDIISNYWYLFIQFIHTGTVDGYLEYISDKSNKTTRTIFLKNLECVNEVSNKLGVIPSFDVFYQHIVNDIVNKDKGVYNPLTLKEDIRMEYQWSEITDKWADVFKSYQYQKSSDNGWSVTKIERIAVGDCKYTYRRPLYFLLKENEQNITRNNITDISGNTVNNTGFDQYGMYVGQTMASTM